jgi:hypothetical protein
MMETRTMISRIFVALTLALAASSAVAVEFPGPAPGQATGGVEAGQWKLENAVISASWEFTDGKLSVKAVDRLSNSTIAVGELFTFVLGDGRTLHASEMDPLVSRRIEDVGANPRAVQASLGNSGKRVAAGFHDKPSGLTIVWQAVLRDGDNYVRQEITLAARKDDVPLKEITLGDFTAKGAKVAGTVRGSPVVAGNWFFACEHPLADNQAQDGQVRCTLPWNATLKKGESLSVSTVVGVAPAGQMRRAFLYYVERQRARPYKPFLHYNSWYDIAWVNRKMNETECLTAIELFGRELTEKRGVRLDSLVFDDGWDDPKTLWGFNTGFPNGFAPLKTAAEKYHTNIGVWVSPWGGYGRAKKDRLQYGKTQGFEMNARGFSLAGPKYFDRFRDVCTTMMERYDVNYFKFDGVGAGGNNTDGMIDPDATADVAALLRLVRELREKWNTSHDPSRADGRAQPRQGSRRPAPPDFYISMTVGTWPSPFWLWWGDSVCRSGGDCVYSGEGNTRQRWMNYRDTLVQQMTVRRGPLYPLNALMSHGPAFARYGRPGKMTADAKDIIDEIHIFFASGTQLQELYVTPQRMTPELWDALAETATWSRANADVLVDSHWIGGDVDKGEPYGYASWAPRMGILCVRNPSPQPKTMTIKLADAFEIPRGGPQVYSLKSPWKADAKTPPTLVAADAEQRLDLEPFEVRVLEATPERKPNP